MSKNYCIILLRRAWHLGQIADVPASSTSFVFSALAVLLVILPQFCSLTIVAPSLRLFRESCPIPIVSMGYRDVDWTQTVMAFSIDIDIVPIQHYLTYLR